MKHTILILFFLLLSFTASAGVADDKVSPPSIAHGTEKPGYMGSVNGGVAFLGMFLHTSHGVFFPSCGLYSGASVQYLWLYGGNYIDIAAHGKYFFPSKKRVQGYIGLEAGVAVALPGYAHPEPGVSDYYPAKASLVVTPALGFVVNFKKVSLDIGAKCRFSPDATIDLAFTGFMTPIPALGIGLVF